MNGVRNKAFELFKEHYNEDILVKCLERNDELGIEFKYKGQMVGDYDLLDDENEVLELIKNGLQLG